MFYFSSNHITQEVFFLVHSQRYKDFLHIKKNKCKISKNIMGFNNPNYFHKTPNSRVPTIPTIPTIPTAWGYCMVYP